MISKDLSNGLCRFGELCNEIDKTNSLDVANASLFVDYLTLFEILGDWQIPIFMNHYNTVSSVWHPNYVDDLNRFIEIFTSCPIFEELQDLGYSGPVIDFISLETKEINYCDLVSKAARIIESGTGDLYAIRELCWLLKSYLQMTHNQSYYHSEPYGGVIKLIAVQNTTDYEKFWEYLTCRAVTFDQMLIRHLIPNLMTDKYMYNSLFKIEKEALDTLRQLQQKEDRLFSKLSTLKE